MVVAHWVLGPLSVIPCGNFIKVIWESHFGIAERVGFPKHQTRPFIEGGKGTSQFTSVVGNQQLSFWFVVQVVHLVTSQPGKWNL